MRSQLWMVSFLVLLSLVLAAPVPANHPKRIELSLPRTTTNSVHTTRFSERSDTVPFQNRLRRGIQRIRWKFERFGCSVWKYFVPEVAPAREDIYLLRAQEDPIFLSAYRRPSAGNLPSSEGGTEKDIEGTLFGRTSTDTTVREILQFVKDELTS